MKLKFETAFRVYVFLLLALLFWAIWADAQSTTNPPASTNAAALARSNAPPVLAKEVTRIEEKLEEHPLTFGLDKVRALREIKPLGQPLWKYLASLIYILLAFYLSRLIDYVVNVWLKKWAERSGTKLSDLLLELLHGPIKIIVFVMFLTIGLNVFEWPPMAQYYLSRGLIIAVSFSLTYLSIKLADLMLALWRERSAATADKLFSEHLLPLIRKCVLITLVIIAVLVTADNLGIKITSVLAGLSIGGLALGLAAQDTVANLFGAVSVFLDKPFRIGDHIRVVSVEGTVESIGLRSTRVRSLDGHHVTIPNKTMGNEVITNVTSRTSIKTEMNLGLPYDTPAAKVKLALKILDEIYRAHPNTADLTVSFNKFGDSALNLQVVHVWNGTDGRVQLAAMQEMNLAVKERFDAEGLSFAFPTQTLYVKQDSPWRTDRVLPAAPQA